MDDFPSAGLQHYFICVCAGAAAFAALIQTAIDGRKEPIIMKLYISFPFVFSSREHEEFFAEVLHETGTAYLLLAKGSIL